MQLTETRLAFFAQDLLAEKVFHDSQFYFLFLSLNKYRQIVHQKS